MEISEESVVNSFSNNKNTSHYITNPDRYSFLMAEDNQDDILITERAWKKANIKNKLYIVNNGEEALDFLYRKNQYVNAPIISLLLLDLNMPKMNGFEVLDIIKKDEKLKCIPVIVLTSSKNGLDVERAYQLGCNSYIVKPVIFENFIDAILEIQRYWLILCEIPRIL